MMNKYEPLELKIGRFLMGCLMVGIFSFFVYLEAYVESPPITWGEYIQDEIKADYRNQLREEMKWKY